MSAGAAASFGLGEVGSVAVDDEDHVAGTIGNDGVGMGRSVVQELFHLGEGLLGGIGLLRGNGAERGEHSEVNGARIIKEGAHDFLDEFLALRIEEWGRVVVGGELVFASLVKPDV